MKKLMLILATITLAQCSTAEDYSRFYPQQYPVSVVKSMKTEKIFAVPIKNPVAKSFLGYLETCIVEVKDSREEKELHWIYDTNHQRIGFIDEVGKFYRYDNRSKTREYIGGYPITDMGLRVFFNIPLNRDEYVILLEPTG